MKIQINSLQALERLIGNDKEMQIAVKESVIEGFTKRYLKSAVTNQMIADLKFSVLKEMKESGYLGLLTVKKSNNPYYRDEFILSDDTKKKIEYYVHEEFDRTVRLEINKIRNELVDTLNNRLDAMAEEVTSCIKEDIRNKTLDKLVNLKLANIINNI